MEEYNVAGKVFILGEYAVLAGLPALVAALGPRFSMKVFQGGASPSGKPSEKFHLDSPIAKLISWAKSRGLPPLSFHFFDPHQGAGGFGASTAQFAMAYLAYAQMMESEQPRRWTQVWRVYRELMGQNAPSSGASSVNVRASGADLVAQWQGGVVFFDPSDEHCLDVWPIFDWSNLLIFSATSQKGRKVPTHQHLANLMSSGFPQFSGKLISSLEEILVHGIAAVQENNAPMLGQMMNHYADALFQAGLELEVTHEDRMQLMNFPDVLGVKGTGALQSDAVLVLVKPKANRAPIIEFAEKRGLRCISEGLTCQMGISAGVVPGEVQ